MARIIQPCSQPPNDHSVCVQLLDRFSVPRRSFSGYVSGYSVDRNLAFDPLTLFSTHRVNYIFIIFTVQGRITIASIERDTLFLRAQQFAAYIAWPNCIRIAHLVEHLQK